MINFQLDYRSWGGVLETKLYLGYHACSKRKPVSPTFVVRNLIKYVFDDLFIMHTKNCYKITVSKETIKLVNYSK